jgi:predicted DNA-binding protein YlxM (UPF0122 family)
MKRKIRIKDLVGDLTYEEIKEKKWKIPRLWRNGKKIMFKNYLISNDGIIISTMNLGGSFIGKRKIARKGYTGYVIVFLYVEGKQYSNIMLHRLLWETFVGRIPKGLQINHKDGIKTNNDLNNLEIVTPKENMEHARKLELVWTKEQNKKHSKKMKGKMIGEKHPNYKKYGEDAVTFILSNNQVEKAKLFHYIKSWNFRKIADYFGVSQSCISGIINGYNRNPQKLSKQEIKQNFLFKLRRENEK